MFQGDGDTGVQCSPASKIGIISLKFKLIGHSPNLYHEKVANIHKEDDCRLRRKTSNSLVLQ